MKKELVTNELEQVAGGFKVSGYDFERGDKFRANNGDIHYVLQAYTKIQPFDFVAALVDLGKGAVIEASVQVSCLIGMEYLGVDIDGMAQALAIARR